MWIFGQVILVAETNKWGFTPLFSLYIFSIMHVFVWFVKWGFDIFGFGKNGKVVFSCCALYSVVGPLINGQMVTTHKSQDGSEEWEYAEVRPTKQNALWLI